MGKLGIFSSAAGSQYFIKLFYNPLGDHEMKTFTETFDLVGSW